MAKPQEQRIADAAEALRKNQTALMSWNAELIARIALEAADAKAPRTSAEILRDFLGSWRDIPAAAKLPQVIARLTMEMRRADPIVQAAIAYRDADNRFTFGKDSSSACALVSAVNEAGL